MLVIFFPNKPQHIVGYTVFFYLIYSPLLPYVSFSVYKARFTHIIPFIISSYRVRHIMERKAEQLLTQHSVSEHSSSTDSEPESPHPHHNTNNIEPRLLSQRSIVYLDSDSSESGDFTPHSSPPPPPSPPTNDNDIESLTIMESRPNSSTENSTRVPLQSITQDAVLEHYVLTRAIDHWNGPKYETYNDKSSRLRTFFIHDWPHMMDLPPNALS